MALLVSFALFGLLVSLIGYAGYRYYARPGRIYEQIGVPAPVFEEGAAAREAGFAVRVIRLIGEKVPVSPQDASLTRRYLIAAGYRSENALAVYYGIRVLCAIAAGVAGFLLRGYVPMPSLAPVLPVAAAGIGFFLPSLVLDQLVSRRQERLRYALPDALDLLVVCVEAGLGLDQALVKVAEELAITHPEISEEFRMVTLEMQHGRRRAEALKNLGERTGEPNIRKLVAVLLQTDRFGTSMADSLRTHSEFMRTRRRQEAEERANKVGVKLVFPIFFCILPAMFLVVAGPGVLQIIKELFPLMRQFGQSGS
ncbi:MAG TPA: type II secretion system F family protein [Bryobacteraceae bacterium]|nr:type II secretion system F family protein [Bryobacteraceae bacterium]